MPIKVLKRSNWKDRAAAPCTAVDEYSIDEGVTWMSRAEFFQWHDDLIEIVNNYPSVNLVDK